MKEEVVKTIAKSTKIKAESVASLLEIPKDSALGDYALPCFPFAKEQKKNPAEIAKDIVNKLENSLEFEKVSAVGGYVNLFLNRSALAEEILRKIQKEKEKYGSSKLGKKKKVVIDMSSPNIAKPFGIGHLRSTIIGNSIANIASALGYKAIKINYLGDWGTQFGKLIVGYRKFGSEKELKKNPIKSLLDWYVKVNEDESLESASREEFKKLELGDKENLKLWKSFRELSLEEFNKIYKLLGIKFDVFSGESLYNKKMESAVHEMQRKKLLKESEGALIVDLENYGITNCLIKKADGATLYATRDIAAAIDRHKKYKFERLFYEVGSEQSLHFRQIFKVLELMGYSWAKNCAHIAHGLYLDKDGKKFATRKGKTLFMEDILNETILLARQEIAKREPKLSPREVDARAVPIALSAIFYGDLKNYRLHDIIFDIEKFLSFEGDTGPYLLYTYARARSIIKKSTCKPGKNLKVKSFTDIEKNLIFQLARYPVVIGESYNSLSPHVIANYSYQLAQIFNEFYHAHQVINSAEEKFRITLVDSFSQVLKNALNLLGISTLEKM